MILSGKVAHKSMVAAQAITITVTRNLYNDPHHHNFFLRFPQTTFFFCLFDACVRAEYVLACVFYLYLQRTLRLVFGSFQIHISIVAEVVAVPIKVFSITQRIQ